MLDKLFMRILDMSITGSFVILVVLLARLLLKKSPKVISYALWSVVLLRLLCPVSVQAPVSVMPEITPVEDTYELTDVPISIAGAGIAAYQAVGDVLNGGIGTQHIPTTNIDELGNVEYVTTDWGDVWVLFGQYVWIAGVVAMVIYSAVSYWKLKKRLGAVIHLRENIYLADEISSPFVIGFVKPTIYLPDSLDPKEQDYIIAHEQHHIRRCDHLIKALAFLTLTIHWFNPLVWVAFILASRDMEMSCDEAVVRKFGPEVRADYAASLLTLATGRRIIGGTPLAFGEGDPKGRIRNLSRWKKPVLWVTVIAVILCAVLAVCLLTDPLEQDEGGIESNTGLTDPLQTEETEPNADNDAQKAQADLEKLKEEERLRQEAEATEATRLIAIGPGADIDFRMITLETKFPFIYDSNDEWLQEYLSKYDYVNVSQLKNGAFYVLDFRANEIRMLIESGVTLIRETPNTAFCVVDGKKLIRIDYYGENIETIYEAEQAGIVYFERYFEYGCLTEKDRIVCINLITYEEVTSFVAPAVKRAVMYSPYQVCWWDDWEHHYLHDITNGVTYPLTEAEYNLLFSKMILQNPTQRVSDEHPTVTVELKCAAIRMGGKTVAFITNKGRLAQIRELFASAEKVSEERVPGDILMGPEMIITGSDDYVTSGQLALNRPMIKIDNIWYRYNTGIGQSGMDEVKGMLSMFECHEWPDWVLDCCEGYHNTHHH